MNIKMLLQRIKYPRWSVRNDFKNIFALRSKCYPHKWNALTAYVLTKPTENGYIAYIADYSFHLASFFTVEQFERYVKRMGIHLTKMEQTETSTRYAVKEVAVEHFFWARHQVPLLARPMWMLSNGSIVKGYHYIKDGFLHIWRPNPNSFAVYSPIKDIKYKYQQVHGIY